MVLNVLERGEVIEPLMWPLLMVKVDPSLSCSQQLPQRIIGATIGDGQLEDADKSLGIAVGLSRQLHRLPLLQKEFSRSPTLFIPCAASSLRFSATGTTGENIGSPFTIPLATCERCQQSGPAWLPLIPV